MLFGNSTVKHMKSSDVASIANYIRKEPLLKLIRAIIYIRWMREHDYDKTINFFKRTQS